MFEIGVFKLFLKFFIALIALCNPFWGIPVFLSMTADFTPAERRRVTLITPSAVAATAIVALLLGTNLLAFFGIHVPSFRIAGGLIILLMALTMIGTETAKQAPAGTDRLGPKRDIAVVPLAVPYLAGPGVITTIIVFAHGLEGVAEHLAALSTIVLVALILWLGLHFAEPLAAFMGETGINIVSKIMAILLAAIAIEMILAGIDQHYPGLHDTPAAAPAPDPQYARA